MGFPLLVRRTQNPVSALTQRVSVSPDTKSCVKIAPVIFSLHWAGAGTRRQDDTEICVTWTYHLCRL